MDAALIGRIELPGIGRLGQLRWGVIWALTIAGIAWFVLSRTLTGFQVKWAMRRVRADLPVSTRHLSPLWCSAFPVRRPGWAWWKCRPISAMQPDISFGYGFTAIIVAFLARLNPLAVIAAGLIVALAELGDSAQIALAMRS